MGAVLEFSNWLETLECGDCGMQFGVPRAWLKDKRDRGGEFSCPNGHPRVFRESETDRLRKQLEVKQAELERAESREASLRSQRQHLEGQLRSTKGALTKVKKRVINGVCPCCNRTFKQLAAHMKTKHPDYAESAP